MKRNYFPLRYVVKLIGDWLFQMPQTLSFCTASSIAQWQSAGIECGRSRVQFQVEDRVIPNVTSSFLVQHSTLKREILGLSRELRKENIRSGIENQRPRRTDNSRTLKKNVLRLSILIMISDNTGTPLNSIITPSLSASFACYHKYENTLLNPKQVELKYGCTMERYN